MNEVFRKNAPPRRDDPYWAAQKYPANTQCRKCGLIFSKGSWKRLPVATHAESHWQICPACIQIQEGYAGGVLRLSGSFLGRHLGDIMNRVRNVEKDAVQHHPLQRIMRIDRQDGDILIYGTSEHLVVRIGKALRRAFKGQLDLRYSPDEKFVRARWNRHN